MLERNTATYTDRIGRLLPTEFVGAYLTVTQTVRDSLDLRQPVCSALGFLDSGLTVFASTLPRPARRGHVAPGRDFDSGTSPAS